MGFEGGFLEFPEDGIVVFEEESGEIKNAYVLFAASAAAAGGKQVTFLTPRHDEDIRKTVRTYRVGLPENFRIVGNLGSWEDYSRAVSGDICIIDLFSLTASGWDLPSLRGAVSGLSAAARNGRTIVLLVDTGILPERHEHLLNAVADGIVQFITVTEGDKIRRYVYVRKMKGMIPVDKLLPITVSDEGILVDTRERHG